jgi:hypothetical protein
MSSKIYIGFMPKFMYLDSSASYLNKIEPMNPMIDKLLPTLFTEI